MSRLPKPRTKKDRRREARRQGQQDEDDSHAAAAAAEDTDARMTADDADPDDEYWAMQTRRLATGGGGGSSVAFSSEDEAKFQRLKAAYEARHSAASSSVTAAGGSAASHHYGTRQAARASSASSSRASAAAAAAAASSRTPVAAAQTPEVRKPYAWAADVVQRHGNNALPASQPVRLKLRTFLEMLALNEPVSGERRLPLFEAGPAGSARVPEAVIGTLLSEDHAQAVAIAADLAAFCSFKPLKKVLDKARELKEQFEENVRAAWDDEAEIQVEMEKRLVQVKHRTIEALLLLLDDVSPDTMHPAIARILLARGVVSKASLLGGLLLEHPIPTMGQLFPPERNGQPDMQVAMDLEMHASVVERALQAVVVMLVRLPLSSLEAVLVQATAGGSLDRMPEDVRLEHLLPFLNLKERGVFARTRKENMTTGGKKDPLAPRENDAGFVDGGINIKSKVLRKMSPHAQEPHSLRQYVVKVNLNSGFFDASMVAALNRLQHLTHLEVRVHGGPLLQILTEARHIPLLQLTYGRVQHLKLRIGSMQQGADVLVRCLEWMFGLKSLVVEIDEMAGIEEGNADENSVALGTALAFLPERLEELKIEPEIITGAVPFSCRRFLHLPEMKKLSLCTRVRISELRNMTKLEELEMPLTPLTEADVVVLSSLKHIRAIHTETLSALAWRALHRIENLHTLLCFDAGGEAATHAAMAVGLSQCTALVELRIARLQGNWAAAWVDSYLAVPSVRTLFLSRCASVGALWTHAHLWFPGLEVLDVVHCSGAPSNSILDLRHPTLLSLNVEVDGDVDNDDLDAEDEDFLGNAMLASDFVALIAARLARGEPHPLPQLGFVNNNQV
jgi:hypothetical protein